MLTGKGQTVVNEFKAAVEDAKAIAKTAAGDAGSDFAEIMAIVDGYVAVIPREISRAQAALGKVWLGAKAVWNWLMNIFQFLDDANGKFSSKRGILVVVLIVGIQRMMADKDWQAAGCAVILVADLVAIALENMAHQKAKAASASAGPQVQPVNVPVDPFGFGGMASGG